MPDARCLRKHGKPIITSPKQGLEYTASLRKSKGLFADVSSGAAANGDGAPVGDTPKTPKSTGNASSGTDPQGNNTTAQTGGTNAPANGTSSTNTGNQTNNTTYSFDSQKVKNSVAALAAKNAGIPTNYWGEPIINNPEDARRYEEEYNKLRKNEDKIRAAAAAGVAVNPDGTPNIHSGYDQKAYDKALKEYHEHKMDELDIDLSTLTFMPDGSNFASGIFSDADKYTIVSEGDPRLKEHGYMTQADYDRICYIVAHETGGTNNFTEMFATASALMNQIEQRYGGSTIKDGLDYYYKYNVASGSADKNSILYDSEQRSKFVDNVKDCVDLALSGIRAFPEEIQGWFGDGKSQQYGTCLDRGGLIRTSGKSGYKQ